MGIDIYAHWRGQTEEEKEAQFTGFSIWHGYVGYLREGYHGGPYSTHVLVPEAFQHNDAAHSCDEDPDAECSACLGVPIPVKTLASRLPAAVFTALVRRSEVCADAEARRILCEVGTEPTLGSNKNPGHVVMDELVPSVVLTLLGRTLAEAASVKDTPTEQVRVPPEFFNPEFLCQLASQFDQVRSLLGFVALAAQKEAELGEPIRVYASY